MSFEVFELIHTNLSEYLKWYGMTMPIDYDTLKRSIARDNFINIKVNDVFGIAIFKEHSAYFSERGIKECASMDHKELLVVYPAQFAQDLVSYKTLSKHVDSLLDKNPNMIIWKAPQSTFIVNMKTHVMVQTHRISEKKLGIDIKASKLSKIFITDPQAIWCRAKIGDILEVVRMDQMAGESINYLEVIRNPTS